MKGQLFLIDENLSPLLALKLQELGYNSKAVRDSSLKGMDDEELIKWAIKNFAVIITSDLDFGERWYWSYYGKLGVIVLRLKSQKLKAQIEMIEHLHKNSVLKNIKLTKALIIVSLGRYRIRIAE